ncbi:MAG TPA: DUF6567 family protein [Cryomorphaceae bacterium]|nr:DUF6567 family protein [Cryomorphaceae bacterium]
MKQLFLIFLTVFLFESCTFHSGTVGAGSGMITSNHFTSISFVSGTAYTVNVFGIGGNNKTGLVLEAKRNLYLNANLKPSQVIGQTTVDFKRTVILPVLITKVTVSAEVIDFYGSQRDSSAIQSNRRKFSLSLREDLNMKAAPFAVGEEVTYTRVSDGRDISARVYNRSGKKYLIEYIDKRRNSRLKKIPLDQLKSRRKITELYEGDINQLITPKDPIGKLVKFKREGKTYIGELIEISSTGYLIRMQKGEDEFVGFYVSPGDIVE